MSYATVAPYTLSPDGTYYIFDRPIEKSDSDDREYRLIKLKNDLEALIIRDNETDKASAALDVHVGSMIDPINLQGLAHFCEHLLFMGTEKYPKENEYQEYLSTHSGRSNAYTSLEHTNYYFEVGEKHFEGALDRYSFSSLTTIECNIDYFDLTDLSYKFFDLINNRFAQFFINPLFDPSCTDRELNAVDSENKNNLQKDSRRLFQLEKSLCNPNHPYNKFGTGNLKTLRDEPLKEGIDVREELLKYHETYYSANIMKLCVLGKEPLDVMTRWVVEKFSAVRNKALSIPVAEGHPLTENELLRITFAKPVMDIRTLSFVFPFPDPNPFFKTKPAHYLSHLIAHKGKGSILSLLKKAGLVDDIDVGAYAVAIGSGFFRIEVDLTEKGLKQYEEVVKVIFQYIDMLKREGVKKWIFDENAQLAAMQFRFKDKSSVSSYTSQVSNFMQRPYPREWILSAPYLSFEYDPAQIEHALDCLRKDRFTLMVVGKQLEGLDQKEKWYGTEYSVKKIGDGFLKDLENLPANNELRLPEPNEFIPANFDVNKKTNITPIKRPTLIKNTKLTRVWHKKDDTFWVPKANIHFFLKTPLAYVTPLHCVKTRLYVELVADALTEYSYAAGVAGLTYSVGNQTEGISLTVQGFNDKIHVLLERILTSMKDFKVDSQRFTLIKEQVQRGYHNSLLTEPYNNAIYYLTYLTTEIMWTSEEALEVLDAVTAEDIQSFYPQLLSSLHIEAIAHGNVSKDQALRVTNLVEDILLPKPLITSQLIRHRSLLLPENEHLVYRRQVFDKKNVNSAVDYYLEVGHVLDKWTRVRLSLLAHIAREPCFDQLRTKEQLGYIVFSGPRGLAGTIGLMIGVQSIKDTVYLENRIEAFLLKLYSLIEDMSEEEYQKRIQSLITTKLEKDKNLRQESYRYWQHIRSGFYEFDRVDQDVAELPTVTKSSLLTFFKEAIHPSSKTRKKLSTHLYSQNPPPPPPPSKTQDINNLFNCLQSHSLTSDIGLQDLHNYSELENFGSLDNSETEKILRKFLAERVKTNEAEMEELVKSVSKAFFAANNGTDSKSKKIVNGVAGDDKNSSERDDTILSERNTIVDDLIVFKSKMLLGPAPTPVVPFEILRRGEDGSKL
ncbi:2424_t:CDS:10 [Paraglomus occultum]|uniref:2424_t:CDS:1 n=1 Tax=Paraglomus occultum TaxID=144539 RepID=A0A9N9FG57_9GLOM|nr:2424_t:CDS:10 [Paraglomus occultum]